MLDSTCIIAFLLGAVVGYLVLPMVLPKLGGK